MPEIKYVVFSFKYLDLDSNPKFRLSLAEDGYQEALLNRMKGVCAMPFAEFRRPSHKSLRSHSIEFADTSEKEGFPLKRELWEHAPWQFSISANKYGRVHGFLLRDIFYVVWLDPKHKLYGGNS